MSGLRRTFTVAEREAGLLAAVRGLGRRRTREVVAVDDVSFRVEAGEVVGFLGPNGAGKTTTLKMLTGLLTPTSGEARVLGAVPWRRDPAFLARITLVMGNRNQLQWDLPALDSYELNRSVYRLPAADFRRHRDELVDLLEIGDLVRKPVRNLSLGERMKAEIVGALLHRPQVLFLDEPTLGLDVTMQRRIRAFLGDYSRSRGATVLLTSHYMADVEALCSRVLLVDGGRLLFDGSLRALADRFQPRQTLTVTLAEPADLAAHGEVVQVEGARVVLLVERERTSAVAGRILAEHRVEDLTIEDPSVEDVIDQAFSGAATAQALP
ncbi:MAG TPA: ATP-binding cassette domain-containing protein [Kineosporiaceae bacterium]|nr:ATP-binding cassette domain-containing protein [Kineosporiaceae bacterium]